MSTTLKLIRESNGRDVYFILRERLTDHKIRSEGTADRGLAGQGNNREEIARFLE